MTIVELAVSMCLLVIGALGFVQATVLAFSLARAQREVAVATQAARETLETMRAAQFDQIFALYNDSNLDDPGGAIAVPGANVAVAGLDALAGDADGAALRIRFPTVSVAGLAPHLREDLAAPEFGLPRDLDGDGVIDGTDHAGDYRLLPVVIEIDWQGARGPQHVELRTLIADY
jgi:hypothetical protein